MVRARLRHWAERLRSRLAMHRSLALLQLRPVRLQSRAGAADYPPAFITSLVASYVRDGVLHAHSFIQRVRPEHLFLSQVYKFNTFYRSLYNASVLGSLALTRWEPASYRTADETETWVVAVQSVFLAVFVADVALQLVFLRRDYLVRSSWGITRMAIVALMVLHHVLFLAGVHVPGVSRAGRAVMLLSRFRNVRRIFSAILGSVPNVASVAAVIAFHIVVFAIIGVQIFHEGEFEHASLHDRPPAFSSVWEGMLQLFILLTTANFPDVMMPYYVDDWWSCLFFIAFLVVGLFFLMNLILAVTYNHFQTQTKARTLRSVRKRLHASLASFYLLAWLDDPRAPDDMTPLNTAVSRARWVDFCGLFRPDLPAALAEELWAQAAGRSSDSVSVAQWMRLIPLSEARLRPVLQLSSRRQTVAGYSRAKRIVNSRWFVGATDALVMANLLLLFLQAVYVDDDVVVELLTTLLRVILVCFVVEIGLKLFVDGATRFWRASLTNRVDLVAVVLSCAADLLELTHWEAIQVSGLLRLVRLARMTRVLRVMNFRTFARILETLATVLPALMRYVVVVVCVFYVFAIIGMEAFAGRITPDNPALAGTPYDQDDYYANNFDDFGNAMVTLFELLVVNQWHAIAAGFVAATNDYAWAFFIVYFCVGVLLSMNVLVAFLLDAFSTELDAVTRPESAAANSGRLSTRINATQRPAVIRDAAGTLWKMRLPHHTLDVYVSMFQDEVAELKREYARDRTFQDIIQNDAFLLSLFPIAGLDSSTVNPVAGVVVVPAAAPGPPTDPDPNAASGGAGVVVPPTDTF